MDSSADTTTPTGTSITQSTGRQTVRATPGAYGDALRAVLAGRPIDAIPALTLLRGMHGVEIATDVIEGTPTGLIRSTFEFDGKDIDTLVTIDLGDPTRGFLAFVPADTLGELDVTEAIDGFTDTHFKDGILIGARTTTHNAATRKPATRGLVRRGGKTYLTQKLPGSDDNKAVSGTSLRGMLLAVNRNDGRIYAQDSDRIVDPDMPTAWNLADAALEKADKGVGFSKVGGVKGDRAILTSMRQVTVCRVSDERGFSTPVICPKNSLGVELRDNEAIAGPCPYGVTVNVYNDDGSKDLRIIPLEQVTGTALDTALQYCYGNNWATTVLPTSDTTTDVDGGKAVNVD